HPAGLAIARDKDFRKAAAVQPLHHFVAVVNQAVFKFQFRHLLCDLRDLWDLWDLWDRCIPLSPCPPVSLSALLPQPAGVGLDCRLAPAALDGGAERFRSASRALRGWPSPR